MKLAFAIALFTSVVAFATEISVALPQVPDRVFNVAENGAVGDGKTDNTAAITKTIAACKEAGGDLCEPLAWVCSF